MKVDFGELAFCKHKAKVIQTLGLEHDDNCPERRRSMNATLHNIRKQQSGKAD
jgi:hypothetical protein